MSEKAFKSQDPKFVKFISTLYSYVYPFVTLMMTLILLFNGAFVSSLCFLVVFVLTLPFVKFKGILKVVLCIGLMFLGLYSTILYV